MRKFTPGHPCCTIIKTIAIEQANNLGDGNWLGYNAAAGAATCVQNTKNVLWQVVGIDKDTTLNDLEEYNVVAALVGINQSENAITPPLPAHEMDEDDQVRSYINPELLTALMQRGCRVITYSEHSDHVYSQQDINSFIAAIGGELSIGNVSTPGREGEVNRSIPALADESITFRFAQMNEVSGGTWVVKGEYGEVGFACDGGQLWVVADSNVFPGAVGGGVPNCEMWNAILSADAEDLPPS